MKKSLGKKGYRKIMSTVKRLTLGGYLFIACGCLSASAAVSHVVTQTNKTFGTKEVMVAPGDTVLFKNTDRVKHNILVEAMGYNSGIQQPGTESALMFDQNGRFTVRCGIHAKMKMTVVVE